MKFLFHIAFILVYLVISFLLLVLLLKPIFISENIIFPYALNPFNIVEKHPKEWEIIKVTYIIFYFISNLIISNSVFNAFFQKVNFPKKTFKQKTYSDLNINVGTTLNNDIVFIPEQGLFQNFLITGTTGSGKTSSFMYPFLEQLINYKSPQTIGMLVLDVKGNFHKQVKKYCRIADREEDVIIIEIGGAYKYNPLHKPNLKPSVLANRLRTILTLFSENNSDTFWFDKVETTLTEAIKLCRLYNSGYVNFKEIHSLVTDKNYYIEKILILKKHFQNNELSSIEKHDLLSAITYFDNEFYLLDNKVLSIIKAEITRITNLFINDLDVLQTFSPRQNELNFLDFSEILANGKIVVLNISIAEYQNLSKILAAYLKLDFQTEVLLSLKTGKVNTTVFMCDEAHEYLTSTDADFFAQSRESKCINIIATQSYSSLLKCLRNEYITKVLIQNLVNKFWFRTDDIYTIENAQKQLGKEDKVKISQNISENSQNSNFNFLLNRFISKNSALAESLSTYVQTDYIYDSKFFTQNLETFSCLSFISNGYSITHTCKIKMKPYFE